MLSYIYEQLNSLKYDSESMKVSGSLFLKSRKALLSLIVSRLHPRVLLKTVVIRCG